MAKIHRSDAPLPQAPSVQVKASYTVTDLPKVSPQEPAAFYDQDNDEDYRRRETAKCKKKRGNLLYTLAMIVFAAIFLISGGLLVKRFLDDRKTESEFADLQSMIDTAATPAPAGENVNPNGARFAALRDKNKDFYLRHDFNKAYSVYGVPYLDEQTTLGANAESDNLIIYGHNMKTGTIFGCLTEYRKADYYQEHPFIEFDTVYGDAKYEVFGAFTIDVVNDTSFIYNQYIDMDEDTYNRYVDQVISRSDVDSGIRPAYGEQLLTLSTCEYSSANGRYVVVARRVGD